MGDFQKLNDGSRLLFGRSAPLFEPPSTVGRQVLEFRSKQCRNGWFYAMIQQDPVGFQSPSNDSAFCNVV